MRITLLIVAALLLIIGVTEFSQGAAARWGYLLRQGQILASPLDTFRYFIAPWLMAKGSCFVSVGVAVIVVLTCVYRERRGAMA